MATAIISTLSLAAALVSTPDDGPFYARKSCNDALQVVMRAEPDVIKPVIDKLAASSDVEDKACAVWLEMPLNEIEMSLEGNAYGLPERREKRLVRLFKFSKVFGRRRPHFAMLEVEARMRRVRLLVKKGERINALKEARRVERMLDQVGARTNPTVDYVTGVTRLAVSQASFPLRVLLGMAGVSGDENLGRKKLEALAQGDSVYAGDAIYLLHHFAHENKDQPAQLKYGKMLTAKFPGNPQFAYEYAKALHKAKRYDDVFAVTERFRTRLGSEPTAWSDRIRKKIYYISAESALAAGKKAEAKNWATLASQQKYGGLVKETTALLKQL